MAEVLRAPKLVPVPDVPDFLPGVINLRGRVVPVVDVAIRFALPERDDNTRAVIIVVRDDEDQVGLLVDGVKRVFPVPDEQVDRKPLPERGTSLIEGVATTPQGDFLVLNIPKLIADCRPQKVSA